jgi:hypothetical protein
VLEKEDTQEENYLKRNINIEKNWVQLTKGFIPLIVVCGNLFGQVKGQVSSEMNQHELG